jgi:cell division protein FtsQ
MARKSDENELLPGVEDTIETPAKPDEAPRAKPRPRAHRAVTPISTPRVVLYAVAAVTVIGLGLYSFHVIEQFLIADTRFALNGPEGFKDMPSLSVAGASHASVSAVESVFQADLGKSVYLIPLADRRTNLREVDWVKDASLARVWPNRLMVRVWERTPVAFIGMGAAKYALIDEDGVVLPQVKDRFRLPVLTGVRASDPAALRQERVHRMLRLTGELKPEITQKISEIDVSDKDNLKVSQTYDNRALTLLLGDHDFYKRYATFERNYEEIRRRLPGASTLDLRLEDRITAVE